MKTINCRKCGLKFKYKDNMLRFRDTTTDGSPIARPLYEIKCPRCENYTRVKYAEEKSNDQTAVS